MGAMLLEQFGQAATYASITTLSRNTTTGVPVPLALETQLVAHIGAERRDYQESKIVTVQVTICKDDLKSDPKADDKITSEAGKVYRVKSPIETIHGDKYYRFEAFRNL